MTYVNYVDQTKETSESSVKLKMNIDFGGDDDDICKGGNVLNFKRMNLNEQSRNSSQKAK